MSELWRSVRVSIRTLKDYVDWPHRTCPCYSVRIPVPRRGMTPVTLGSTICEFDMKIHPFLRSMRLFQTKPFWISIFIFVLASLVFIPTIIVKANSAPPPTKIWIIFYDQNKNPASLEGFQIIECNDENCSTLLPLAPSGKGARVE